MLQRLIQSYREQRTRIHRLSREGGWIVAGQAASVLGSLALVRVLTEYLEPAEYGELALGLTVATLVNQVALGGLIAAIGRYYSIATHKGDASGYLKAARRMLIISTAVVLGLGIIVIGALAAADLRSWLWLATAALVFAILSSVNSALNGIQNAARQRSIVALHGGMDSWLKIGLAVGVMLVMGTSSAAVVVGYALSAMIVTLSQFFFLRRLIARQHIPCPQTTSAYWSRQMWLFAWPMMLGGLFNWGYYASQRWALEFYVSSDEVGKFYALTQVTYTPIALAGSLFMSFITPIIYSRVGDPEDQVQAENAKKFVFKMAGIGLGATLLAAIISGFAHEWMFRILVEKRYRDYSVFMPLVVLAAGFLQSSLLLGLYATSKNQTKIILPLAVYGQACIIGLNLASTYAFGVVGLMVTMVCGAVLHFFWMLWITRKIG
jgi:O-antigen/teichoic acid export membrane protein